MLTCELGLEDAIVNLLANCPESAIRIVDGDTVDFAQHVVKIKLAEDEFSTDHIRFAISYALKIGLEPEVDRDYDRGTARHEVSCDLSEMIMHRCGERRAVDAMAGAHSAKGCAELLSRGAVALFDATEAEPKTSQANCAAPSTLASPRSTR
jgi:hypothetical protein